MSNKKWLVLPLLCLGLVSCPVTTWAAQEPFNPSETQGYIVPEGGDPNQPQGYAVSSSSGGSSGPSLYQESLRLGVKADCWSNGNCSLQDLVMTGTAFANILIELSGALFLLTFIYGGARYLMSFGNKGWVEKGTSAMKGGAIGMFIVMAAWSIVTYLAKAFVG